MEDQTVQGTFDINYLAAENDKVSRKTQAGYVNVFASDTDRLRERINAARVAATHEDLILKKIVLLMQHGGCTKGEIDYAFGMGKFTEDKRESYVMLYDNIGDSQVDKLIEEVCDGIKAGFKGAQSNV